MMPAPFMWALRDLRGSMNTFVSFLICLTLGVASIVAVLSLSEGISSSMNSEGQGLLGGDLEASLVNRPASASEIAGLQKYGTLSKVMTMRGMARVPANDKTALIEIKVVDRFYPFFGDLIFENSFEKQALFDEAQKTVAVEKEMLDKLGLKLGDVFTLGESELRIGAVIKKEPDRVSSGFILRPRVMMDMQTLETTGLLKPGSLLRWRYRLKIEENALLQNPSDISEALKQEYPDAGWRLKTRDNAAPGIQRFVDRLTLFFTMMALTSLIVGGVAIATGVRTYLSRKQQTIATLKCLGASSRQILATYFIEIGLVASMGIAMGLVLGASVPFVLENILQGFIPFSFQAQVHGGAIVASILFGLLTALIFSLWPLGQAIKTRAADLFRSQVAPLSGSPSMLIKLATFGLIVMLVLLFLELSTEKKLVIYYFGALFLGYGFLFVASIAIRKFARLISPRMPFTSRMALKAIYRPGSLTSIMLVSLGLGLMLLVTLSLIEFNLSKQVSRAIPQKAPAYFFISIEQGQTTGFRNIIEDHNTTSKINMQPILNGRITAVKNIRADKAPAAPEVKWALRGDRGLTFSPVLPEGSKLVEGEWWEKNYQGPPIVSISSDVGKGLGLNIGDMITVNVLGRSIEAKIANMREVEWSNLGINFVLVFSPNSFAGAPYTYLATVSLDEKNDTGLVAKISKAYPNIYAVSVRDSISSIISLMEKMSWAVRGASAFAILVAIFVLAGSLVAQNRSRLYELGILKTIGVTRSTLVRSFVIEFGFLGLLTGVFAAVAGSICSYMIVEQVLKVDWSFSMSSILSVLAIALILTLLLGMGTIWRQLGRKPASILNNG